MRIKKVYEMMKELLFAVLVGEFARGGWIEIDSVHFSINGKLLKLNGVM